MRFSTGQKFGSRGLITALFSMAPGDMAINVTNTHPITKFPTHGELHQFVEKPHVLDWGHELSLHHSSGPGGHLLGPDELGTTAVVSSVERGVPLCLACHWRV